MNKNNPRLLMADVKGRILPHSHLEAAGMKAGHFFRLDRAELIKIPPNSRLFMLPYRAPVGYEPESGRLITVERDPFSVKGGACFAVAAFTPPGYTITYNSAYREIARAAPLPLFSYAAVALYGDDLYVTAIRVDRDRRHDARFIDMELVNGGIRRFKKLFPANRLIRHLEACALTYGCPGAQNFFLSRYEGPLPSSPFCNARCAGCISYQGRKICAASQPRIRFVPTPEELSEIALFHIQNVNDPVVSFGQGCEGEPLMTGGVIEKAIMLIRNRTSKGIINMNTNGSMPELLNRLIGAGLDSIRVSLNSVREPYYLRYYKPVGYVFRDVLSSIESAKRRGAFVSINCLTAPGFTDMSKEFTALERFIETYRIDMIQWRNLNFDPLRYFKELKMPADYSKMIGINKIIRLLAERFPNLLMGYFNPAPSKIKSARPALKGPSLH